MRPVNKWNVGDRTISGHLILEDYKPHRDANQYLQENLGPFCSYCEIFESNPPVEHIVSKKQDNLKITKWDNFLLCCSRCNGSDNKWKKTIEINNIYLPHLNNTYHIFIYREGGYVAVNPRLNDEQKVKAKALMDLVCLDKFVGNLKYPKILAGDKRWEHRKNEWNTAQSKLDEFISKQITDPETIADYAYRKGFFSIWFTVFEEHSEVRKALINKFEGTAIDCFDATDNYQPIPRNPTNHPADTI